MVDRYWMPNGNTNANTAANWNTVADGSGATGVPIAGDIVHFGDQITLSAGKGNGACTWDITPTLDQMIVNEGYRSIELTGEVISFVAPSTIVHAEQDWDISGFRAGMKIVVTGSTLNNASYDIATVAGDTITVVQTSIADEAAGATVTLSYSTSIDINASFGLNLLSLNGEIKNTSGINYIISFSGTHPASDQRYILNYEHSLVSNGGDLEYDIDGSANGSVATYFDDGYYPKITCSGGVFSFGYKAPSYDDFNTVSMYGMTVNAGVSITVDATATPQDNQSKYFIVENASQFSSLVLFDAGKSTWEFVLDVGSFSLPISDAINTFRWYNLVISTSTAGRKVTIPSNRTLSVNSLVVGVDAVLEGHKTAGEATSVVISVRRPKILGAWNFSQLSDGIYASLMESALPITPADGEAGRVQLSNGAGAFTSDGDLTFDDTLNNLQTVGMLFDTTNLIDVASEGEVRWDENEQTLAVGTINAIHAHLGQTFQYNVKNQTGGLLTAGTVVMAVGTVGSSGRILVDAMDASATGDAHLLLGVLQEDVINGADSAALALGKIKGINVTALKPVSETWVDGDVLYCDQANNGGLTNVRPSSGIILPIAFIIDYASNGTLAVRALPIDEGATGGGGGTPAGSNTQVQFNDGGSFGASADLTWDDTAKELYVDGKLTVTGLIDPTGLELAPQGANPSNLNTLWLDSLASNRLKQGNTKIIQEGDPVSDLADDGTYATAAQGATADAALPKAGGTMTGEIEATTMTLNAVPADPQTGNKVRLGESGATTNMLRIQTDAGYIDIGPNNGSYGHIYTDRTDFYFSKPLIVDGGGQVFAYNDGLKLGTGTRASSGTTAITIANGSTDITVAGTTTSTGFIKTGGLATEYLMADGSVTTSGGGGGTPSGAAGAIQFSGGATFASDDANLHWDDGNNRLGVGTNIPSETLHVKGNMLVEDPSSTGSSDHLLEVKSGSSATPDNARILVSADTDAKLPMFNLRDVEANGGTFSPNYSAYIALDRATPIVTGSAQNDMLIANGNYNKDIHLCTNNAGNGLGAQARLTIASDGDVGIGTTNPDNPLHVVGAGDFPFRVQADEGNLRMNKYGHLHIQNDNSPLFDGTTIDSPLYHIGQRDSGVLDISFGALSGQLVSLADSLIQMQRAGNSATGQKQIGFLGAAPTGAIDDGGGAPLQPVSPALVGPTPNEALIAAQLDAILAGLQTLGLFL